MADSKIQDLTATTTPLSTDILYIVVDPGGTPLDRKVTVGNLVKVSLLQGLGTGVGTFLATPSSANLLAALTTKTGTGNAVFDTSPTLVTPIIGVATGTSITLTGRVKTTTPGSSAAPAVTFGANDQTGVYSESTDSSIDFTIGGNRRVFIAATSVGILHNSAAFEMGAGLDTKINRAAAGIVGVVNAFQFTEMTPPSAPAATKVDLYCDTSGGKTRLMALFASGAAQQVAIQP
jgi:hypothetical protein